MRCHGRPATPPYIIYLVFILFFLRACRRAGYIVTQIRFMKLRSTSTLLSNPIMEMHLFEGELVVEIFRPILFFSSNRRISGDELSLGCKTRRETRRIQDTRTYANTPKKIPIWKYKMKVHRTAVQYLKVLPAFHPTDHSK